MKITLNIIDGFCKKNDKVCSGCKGNCRNGNGCHFNAFIFSIIAREEGLFKTGKNCDFFFKLGRAIFRIEALMHNALDNMIVITSKK